MPQEPTQEQALEEQAMLLAGEIFDLINQYTHDSNVSKFFLNDDLAKACYGLSGGFAAVVYTPSIKPEQVQDTTALSFLYALMTYGFNIYLKERSLLTSGSPYSLPYDSKIIKKAQKKVLNNTSVGKLTSTLLADKVIDIILENVQTQMNFDEFKLNGHRLNKKKFFDYGRLSLYWGYNFARELLREKRKPKDS